MNEKPKNPAAVALGRIRSDKKTASCRENGKKGGRPSREIVAMLTRKKDGWWIASYRGGKIPAKKFETGVAAKAYAQSKGWSVKRLAERDW